VQSEAGGFCAWRDVANDKLAFEYPELTGYALSWLAGLSEPDEREIRAGRRAAEWLIRRLSVGDRSARTGWDSGAVYTFDLGMISAGLISFGRLVDEPQLVEQGQATARQLARYVERAEGLLAIVPDGPPSGRPPTWSTAGRPHLVKCVQALLLADEYDAARRLSIQAVDAQDDGGRFQTQPNGSIVMLHPHFYAVEGLWMLASACNDDGLLERARAATRWAWEHQLPSGGMPRWATGHEVGPEQVDVTGQAIRAAVLLHVDVPRLDSAVARLAALAQEDGHHGYALIYEPASAHLNAWATMFAGQAIGVAIDGPRAVTWTNFV